MALVSLVGCSILISGLHLNFAAFAPGLLACLGMSGVLFMLVLGAFFVAQGLQDTEHALNFLTCIGGCFLGFGGYGLLQARKSAKEKQQ